MLCAMDAAPPLPSSKIGPDTDQLLDICIVTETYPPEVNGVARTMSRIVEGLRDKGHHVHVVRPRQASDREPPDTTLVSGIDLPLYKELKLGLPAHQTLRRLWSQHRPDVIYITTEGPLGLSALREARYQNIPALSGFHTNFHTYSSHYRLGPLKHLVFHYLRYFHNRTACTLAPSPDLVTDLRQQGFHSVEQMARGVDTELFSPQHRNDAIRREWGFGEEHLGVLYVGRIAAEKNLSLAERAFRRIQSAHPLARFVLVGDGPMRASMEKRNPDFIFCGMHKDTSLAERYASADLLLFPSMTETFGNVVLEAMASGLPVFAYDYAAPRMHIKSGHNGLTVPFGDEESYLALADHVVEQGTPLQSLGSAARDTAIALGWDRVVQRFENLLWVHVDTEEVEHEYA